MIFIVQLLTIPIFFLLSFFSLLVIKHHQYLVQVQNNIISLRNMHVIADRLNADMKYVDPSQIPVDYSACYYVAAGVLIGVVIASLLVVFCRSELVDIPSISTALTPYVPGPPCIKCNTINDLLTNNDNIGIVLMSPENFERLEGAGPLINHWLFKKTITASGTKCIEVLEQLGDIGDRVVLTTAQIHTIMLTNRDFYDVLSTFFKMP